MQEIIILIGCGRAGKTTYAKKISKKGYEYLTIDGNYHYTGKEEYFKFIDFIASILNKNPSKSFILDGYLDFDEHFKYLKKILRYHKIKPVLIFTNCEIIRGRGPGGAGIVHSIKHIIEKYKNFPNIWDFEEFIEGNGNNKKVKIHEEAMKIVYKKFELKDLPIRIKLNLQNKRKMIFKSNNNLICKISDPDREIENKEGIITAGVSPTSNGLFGFVYKEEKCLGWIEEFLEGKIYKYFENEIELFKLHCLHQIFLSKKGYFDLDPATINFIKKTNGKIVNFDKGATRPIASLNPDNWDLEEGSYFKCLRRSYKQINRNILSKISLAMATKNSIEIEKTYQKILEELK